MNWEGRHLAEYWLHRVAKDCPEYSHINRKSIVNWLIGSDLQGFQLMTPEELGLAKLKIENRWQILSQRYLGFEEKESYANLMSRLASAAISSKEVKVWVRKSSDRSLFVLDILHNIVQNMLQTDKYMQLQINYIGKLTQDKNLRNALLLTNLEEYCWRSVNGKSLLSNHFKNYLSSKVERKSEKNEAIRN
jgi:hypothetical protein